MRRRWCGSRVKPRQIPLLLPAGQLFGLWRGQRLRDIEPLLEPGGKYELATLELYEGMKLTRRCGGSCLDILPMVHAVVVGQRDYASNHFINNAIDVRYG